MDFIELFNRHTGRMEDESLYTFLDALEKMQYLSQNLEEALKNDHRHFIFMNMVPQDHVKEEYKTALTEISTGPAPFLLNTIEHPDKKHDMFFVAVKNKADAVRFRQKFSLDTLVYSLPQAPISRSKQWEKAQRPSPETLGVHLKC